MMLEDKRPRDYAIDVPAFSGPLDLLLHLIDRNELDIAVISLAQVTDQYLAQVALLKEGKVSQLIDFIVIGARLMVIKSRALLPAPPVTLEGEDEEDPAEALLRQLRLYKMYKDVASRLKAREEAGLHTYLRVAAPPKTITKLDLSGTTTETLLSAMLTVLTRLSVREDSVSVVERRSLTIEGQIAKVRDTVRQHPRVGFRSLLSADRVTQVEMSVTLLALLEMVKRREVRAEQDDLFGPIMVERIDDADEA